MVSPPFGAVPRGLWGVEAGCAVDRVSACPNNKQLSSPGLSRGNTDRQSPGTSRSWRPCQTRVAGQIGSIGSADGPLSPGIPRSATASQARRLSPNKHGPDQCAPVTSRALSLSERQLCSFHQNPSGRTSIAIVLRRYRCSFTLREAAALYAGRIPGQRGGVKAGQ